MPRQSLGTISATEAYSKTEVLTRLDISQKSWDKMLDAGLPFAQVGKARWVLGQDLIEYLQRISEQKGDESCRL